MNLVAGLIGSFFAILSSVFLPPGNVEQVYVGWGGLKTLPPTHYRELVDMQVCDNYILDSKSEESPRFSAMSVRPGETPYLDDPGGSIRGLFNFNSPSGDSLIIMANTTGLYKSSGSSWTLLSNGFSDNPWEGYLYGDPNVTRLYLCNGRDSNKKYLTKGLFNMQNQADYTVLSGSVTFTKNSSIATGDATSAGSIEVGMYITSTSEAADTSWVEVVSKEGTNLTLSTPWVLSTVVANNAIRSNNVVNSKHVTEYEGHIVLGYTNIDEETIASSTTTSTEGYVLLLAKGAYQKFTATTNNITKVRLALYQLESSYSSFNVAPHGNLIVKIKESVASSFSLASISKPISELPDNLSDVYIDLGYVALTVGNDYYMTIERETSSDSPVYLSITTGGESGYTHSSSGFLSGWNTGSTTIEKEVDLNSNFNYNPDTYIKSDDPTAFSQQNEAAFNVNGTTPRKTIVQSFTSYWWVNPQLAGAPKGQAWENVKLKIYKTSTGVTGEVKALQCLPNSGTFFLMERSSWNNYAEVYPWYTAGANRPELDYSTLGASSVILPSNEGWVTFEVTTIVSSWEPLTWTNGILITAETGGSFNFSAFDSGVNVPTWSFTVKTGTTESGKSLNYSLISEDSDSSTIIYSRRFKPELFPTDNTFKVPGQVCGLLSTGGYLVVGARNPDSLHYYRYTGETTDGLGIDFVTSIPGITIGSSKSIAQLPKGAGSLFFSGAGVYNINGLNIQLRSGNIREEAKKFASYRDSSSWYSGLASLMPQGVVLPTKDTYLLAVPLALGFNSYVYAYNYANDTWTRWTGLYPTSMLVRDIVGQEPQLYYGYNTGQVYTQDQTGSTTQEAIAEFYLSGKDLSKDKQLDKIELFGIMDNPLSGSYVTLEVSSTDPGSSQTSTTTKKMTFGPFNNSITNANKTFTFLPNYTAKEFKIRFTQKATEGAANLRSIRYKYTVKGGT
jgi:hypothetical protein